VRRFRAGCQWRLARCRHACDHREDRDRGRTSRIRPRPNWPPLLRRIGADDDHFAIVERIPEEGHVFLQTWRDGDGPFRVEYRDGGPDRHFGAESADADQVIAVFLDWSRGGSPGIRRWTGSWTTWCRHPA